MQFLFADHTLDTDRRELRRGHEPVAVEPQVFDVLTYLVENRDRVVSKDDLIASVWRGRITSDATLSSRIYAARKAVGDSGNHQKLIRTIARRGLRFVGDVRTQPADVAAHAADPSPDKCDAPLAPTAGWTERPAIAVLPFVDLSGDPEQDYFADGISEELITALSRLRWLMVIARNSSFTYKGRAVHMKQVAEELGARYVVEGSVRRAGDRVRITVQLNDVAIGRQIWSERYDRDLAHVFAVQDEITEAVVAAIEPQIYAAENFRARRKPPESLDGWDLVMRALSHYWRVTQQDNVAAQALLEQAIAIDPTYGQALGVLAVSLTFGGYMAWVDMPTVLPVAERAARAAIDADRDDPWAHNGMGFVHLLHRRFDDSLAEFEWALRLNPNFALAQGYYALALSVCGQWQEADHAADRALRLSPRDPFAAIYCGIAAYTHYVGRNYEAAICFARQSIRQRGDFVGAHRVLTAAAGITGQRDLAAAALAGLRRTQPNVSLAWIERSVPIRDAAEAEHYLDGLRRAGLT